MSTYNELRSKAANLLEDPGMIQYTSLRLTDSLQDAFDDVACETRCIEKVTQQSWPFNSAYWTVTDSVPNYFAPTAIFNRNNNKWLTSVTYKTLEALHEKWDTTTGTPEYFCPIDFNTIAFYPTYAAAQNDYLVLFYIAQAPDITSTQSIDLFPRDDEVLVNYVVMDMFDATLEYKKAIMYNKEYSEHLERVKKDMKRRNSADRIMQMLPQYVNMDR